MKICPDPGRLVLTPRTPCLVVSQASQRSWKTYSTPLNACDENLLKIMLCQMTGSSFFQNTTNSRFLYLGYQIRKLPMQRTIDFFAAVCMKGGKRLLSSRTFTSQDVAPLETPRTKHPCETTPFLHRTVANLPKFYKSCELVIFSASTAGFNELSKGNHQRVSLHIWILIKLWSSRTTKSVAVSLNSNFVWLALRWDGEYGKYGNSPWRLE